MTKKLQKSLDKKWREKTPNAKCELCEFLGVNFKCNQLHPHHIIGRRNLRLRWDIRNRCWICPSHHTLGVKSAHNDPHWFHCNFKQMRPDDWEYVNKVKNEITHYKDSDYDIILNKMEEK